MEIHEVANIFPMMSDDEYQQLVNDIRLNGLREPIWLHQNKIIDGRNRYKACNEVGVSPRFREWDGNGSLVAFVVSLNLSRRHLTSSQKAMIALDVEKHLAKENRVGRPAQDINSGNISGINGESRESAATTVGTNSHYVTDAKKIVAQAPELKEAVLSGKLNIPDAKVVAKLPEPQRVAVMEAIAARKAKNVKEAVKVVKQEDRKEVFVKTEVDLTHYNVYHCDISDLSSHVAANSVDVIITDPPYPQEFLHVYDSLGKFAAHALKPGGSLIVMVGQSYLPSILSMLNRHLDYHWMLTYLTPGGQSAQLWQRKVNTFWKPLLWFTKGDYAGDWIGDVCKSSVNDNDKDHHHWGQSESGMADIIERFSLPGQLICDPFVGGGTTAVVAASSKRYFVGCDIEAACVEKTLQRVCGVLHEQF